MRRACSILGVAIFFLAAPVLAQQQPLCIPGTTYCLPTQANGQVGGGANGQVGPNGANGGAHGAATGAATQPQPPPPQYRPPPPPPTYAPPAPPPPYRPPPQVPAPLPPQPPTYAPSYASSSGRGTTEPGIGIYPVVRVGKDSGFHLGGDISFAVHDAYWGFGLDTIFVTGGTVSWTDISFVPNFVFRFGPSGDPKTFDGFYLLAGPEVRFGFGHREETSGDGQVFSIGFQTGAGYERTIASDISWRILEIRAVGVWRTDSVPVPDDNFGHKNDLGLLFMSGITFY